VLNQYRPLIDTTELFTTGGTTDSKTGSVASRKDECRRGSPFLLPTVATREVRVRAHGSSKVPSGWLWKLVISAPFGNGSPVWTTFATGSSMRHDEFNSDSVSLPTENQQFTGFGT
jgi:hypothetical protein